MAAPLPCPQASPPAAEVCHHKRRLLGRLQRSCCVPCRQPLQSSVVARKGLMGPQPICTVSFPSCVRPIRTVLLQSIASVPLQGPALRPHGGPPADGRPKLTSDPVVALEQVLLYLVELSQAGLLEDLASPQQAPQATTNLTCGPCPVAACRARPAALGSPFSPPARLRWPSEEGLLLEVPRQQSLSVRSSASRPWNCLQAAAHRRFAAKWEVCTGLAAQQSTPEGSNAGPLRLQTHLPAHRRGVADFTIRALLGARPEVHARPWRSAPRKCTSAVRLASTR